MSLKSIGHFQKAIYEILKTDAELSKMVAGIYLSVQQDVKYPFILVSLTQLQDVSKYTKKIYEIEFEIEIFTREKLHEPALKIADHVSRLIDAKPIGVAVSNVIAMRKNTLEWVRGHDLLTSKLVMKYKGMIGN